MYPGLVSCPFYAIPIIIPFQIYEIFYLLVKFALRCIRYIIIKYGNYHGRLINSLHATGRYIGYMNNS